MLVILRQVAPPKVCRHLVSPHTYHSHLAPPPPSLHHRRVTFTKSTNFEPPHCAGSPTFLPLPSIWAQISFSARYWITSPFLGTPSPSMSLNHMQNILYPNFRFCINSLCFQFSKTLTTKCETGVISYVTAFRLASLTGVSVDQTGFICKVAPNVQKRIILGVCVIFFCPLHGLKNKQWGLNFLLALLFGYSRCAAGGRIQPINTSECVKINLRSAVTFSLNFKTMTWHVHIGKQQ